MLSTRQNTHTLHPSSAPDAGSRPSAVHSMSQFSESEELLLKTNLLVEKLQDTIKSVTDMLQTVQPKSQAFYYSELQTSQCDRSCT